MSRLIPDLTKFSTLLGGGYQLAPSYTTQVLIYRQKNGNGRTERVLINKTIPNYLMR